MIDIVIRHPTNHALLVGSFLCLVVLSDSDDLAVSEVGEVRLRFRGF
jgi:hypothetical protein